MYIKHTKTEIYKVYSYLPCKGSSFKDIKRWFPFKHFRSKQAALNAIKRFKVKHAGQFDGDLLFKIVWSPSPFASVDDDIIVYNEDECYE